MIEKGLEDMLAPRETEPILICYDRSANSRNAIEYAGEMFPGQRALVLYVWTHPVEFAAIGLTAALYTEESLRDLGTEIADEGCEIARSVGLEPTPIVASGSSEGTSRTILRIAEERQARVVVIGSRGLGRLKAAFLGSVSHGVVQHAHRPSLVVPTARDLNVDRPERGVASSGGIAHPVPDDRPVLMCFDGSASAQHAIDVAASLLGNRRAVVLTVWSSPIGMAAHGMAAAGADYKKEQEQRASDSAAEGSRLARDAGLNAVPLTAWGNPEDGTARTILNIADEQDANLIVLGARGLSGLRSLMLGSVSHGVVNPSHRPVLVAPGAPASPY